MEDKIKLRIEELKKMKENLLANVNAVDGAIIELNSLLATKTEVVEEQLEIPELTSKK